MKDIDDLIMTGQVSYKGNTDIYVGYVMIGDKAYYFFDKDGSTVIGDKCRVATTDLKEVVDPMVESTHVGLLDRYGNEVIPFNNRDIRLIDLGGEI